MNKMEMIKVQSSNVDKIGYDELNCDVYVRFLSGKLYVYRNVPIHEFEALRSASSVGSYLHRNYKNVYAYELVG